MPPNSSNSLPGQHSQTFTAADNRSLGCQLFLPVGYNSEVKDWPLIYFLHGRGERGGNLQAVKAHGVPRIVEEWKDFPFITISPQCPGNSRWTDITDLLIELLDDIISRYNVDDDRIYLTGLSMGGQGAWALGSEHPEKFAAIAAICGRKSPTDVKVLRNTPLRVFHGDRDNVVPYEDSVAMVEEVKAAGGAVNFTTYPGVGHNCWSKTYNNPELYEWFLSCRREK